MKTENHVLFVTNLLIFITLCCLERPLDAILFSYTINYIHLRVNMAGKNNTAFLTKSYYDTSHTTKNGDEDNE